MWRRGSVRLPIMFFWLPVVRGLHTLAKAAASRLGICVQAGVGGAVLDCSGTTDPEVEEGIDEQGQRADNVSLTNLSWVEAAFEVLGRRFDIESLTSFSWALVIGVVELDVGDRGA